MHGGLSRQLAGNNTNNSMATFRTELNIVEHIRDAQEMCRVCDGKYERYGTHVT